eukprot:TRINITY_DN9299_c0_g1_i4.p1 TRINITY_DN9299_c0_g1~~TRINITY_DN9299_c0_g1_i4.p1  ORF type:complete len:132 (-),score=0.77 TRINITY_DN9299_c0_g1_i4:174-548(-)
MIRRPPRSTRKESSAASDVYKRQVMSAALEIKDIFIGSWIILHFAQDLLPVHTNGIKSLLKLPYTPHTLLIQHQSTSNIRTYSKFISPPLSSTITCSVCTSSSALRGTLLPETFEPLLTLCAVS